MALVLSLHWGQYYKNYNVVIAPLYIAKWISVDGVHRNLPNTVLRRNSKIVILILQAWTASVNKLLELTQVETSTGACILSGLLILVTNGGKNS